MSVPAWEYCCPSVGISVVMLSSLARNKKYGGITEAEAIM